MKLSIKEQVNQVSTWDSPLNNLFSFDYLLNIN
jgi:hypothetical protein